MTKPNSPSAEALALAMSASVMPSIVAIDEAAVMSPPPMMSRSSCLIWAPARPCVLTALTPTTTAFSTCSMVMPAASAGPTIAWKVSISSPELEAVSAAAFCRRRMEPSASCIDWSKAMALPSTSRMLEKTPAMPSCDTSTSMANLMPSFGILPMASKAWFAAAVTAPKASAPPAISRSDTAVVRAARSVPAMAVVARSAPAAVCCIAWPPACPAWAAVDTKRPVSSRMRPVAWATACAAVAVCCSACPPWAAPCARLRPIVSPAAAVCCSAWAAVAAVPAVWRRPWVAVAAPCWTPGPRRRAASVMPSSAPEALRPPSTICRPMPATPWPA